MDTLEHRIQLCQVAAQQLTQYLQTLSAEAWHHPSACEGWEVCDVVGHLTWVEELYVDAISRGLQGDIAPLEDFPPVGVPQRAAFIAQQSIAHREGLGEQLLATFTARHDQLLHLLRSLSPEDWEKPCVYPGIVEPRPAHQFLPALLKELAMHAWDIWSLRDSSRPLFAESLPIFLEGLPRTVARGARPDPRLRAPIRYRFAVTGAVPSQYDIVLEGEHVRMEPAGTTAAQVKCQCDAETFVLLMYGRLAPPTAITSSRLVVEGTRDPMTTFDTWFKFI